MANAHIKNSRSLKKSSEFTPTIHINPNSYSFKIKFIMIIVRFFIICFINGYEYKKWPQTETESQTDAFTLQSSNRKKKDFETQIIPPEILSSNSANSYTFMSGY